MKVAYSRHAERDLDSLPDLDRRTVLAAVDAFAAGRSPNADVVKLQGSDGAYRLRVGRWRVLYEIGGGTLLVQRVAPRKDAYR